jgi:hypothetical protein
MDFPGKAPKIRIKIQILLELRCCWNSIVLPFQPELTQKHM